MTLLKNGCIEKDLYTNVSEAETIPADGHIIVSLSQWQEQREVLSSRSDPLGIVLHSDEKPAEIAAELDQFAIIALDFPAFADGRAYSYARLLRDRYGYTGELRAVGDVLLEQLHFMHRVGFNSFDINSDDAIAAWETAAADISVWYQPTGDGRTPVIRLRHPD
jgi:uncharacterized protein (DUF934 family)